MFMCVPVCKISQKILDRSTSHLRSYYDLAESLSLVQGGNHSSLKKKCPGERVRVGGRNLTLMIRDKRKMFKWLELLNGER